jgi:hypothetical protein
VGRKRVANQSSQPEIYHLLFVRVSAGARCLPEDGNELWPISASYWPISGSLVPVLPFPRTRDSAFREPSLRPPKSQGVQRSPLLTPYLPRRPFLGDRCIFVTVGLLEPGARLEEAEKPPSFKTGLRCPLLRCCAKKRRGGRK